MLIAQVKTYQIDTASRLDGCIGLVFEKAVSEPNFATAYAEMCKEIAGIFVPMDQEGGGGAEKKAIFKNRLINQCQQEFERHRDDSAGRQSEVAGSTPEEKVS